MSRLLGSRVPVLLLAGALVAGCGLEHESDLRSDGSTEHSAGQAPEAPGDVVLADTVDPQLFSTPDGLALVGSRLADDGPFGGVVTSARVDGAWSPAELLSGEDVATSTATVRLNSTGEGVAVWSVLSDDSQADSEEIGSPPLVGRVREADGTWTPAEELGSIVYLDDIQVSARGDVAVVGYPDEGNRMLALHPAGGTWEVHDLPTYDAPTVALDDKGGVHLATTETDRGGGGTIKVSYLPPGGAWTAPQTVPVEHTATEPARILALPGGDEVLVVGTISSTWQSTWDTQYYWGTDYRLLRRSGTSGPFEERWSRDGATNLQAVVDGEGVRLTWTQNEQGVTIDGGEGPVTAPTRLALLSRGPDGAVVRLDEAPVHPTVDGDTQSGITFATAPGCGGIAAIWRTRDDQDRWSDLQVRVGDAVTSFPDEGARPAWGLEAAVACSADEAWVARSVDLEQVGSDDAGDLHLTEGSIGLEPAGE